MLYRGHRRKYRHSKAHRKVTAEIQDKLKTQALCCLLAVPTAPTKKQEFTDFAVVVATLTTPSSDITDLKAHSKHFLLAFLENHYRATTETTRDLHATDLLHIQLPFRKNTQAISLTGNHDDFLANCTIKITGVCLTALTTHKQ